MHFLPVFELMSDSLTDTKVETNQCPLHQSILLTQGPIHENFEFLSWPFWIFSLLHLIEKCSPFLWGIIFSALWMVFPESWKRSCPNFYAHDCMHLSSGLLKHFFSLNHVIVRFTKIMNNLLKHIKIGTFKIIFLH